MNWDTLIGGLIGILGGVIGSYYAQKLARDEERRAAIRKKVEKIYRMADQIADWAADLKARVSELSHAASDGSSTPWQAEDGFSSDLVMLVRLYLPSLATTAARLQANAQEFAALCDSIYESGNRVTDQQMNRATELERTMADDCRKIRSDLESEIQF